MNRFLNPLLRAGSNLSHAMSYLHTWWGGMRSNCLRWSTFLALLAAVAALAWTYEPVTQLSEVMKRRSRLGLAQNLRNPGLAVQLAGDSRTLAELFAASDEAQRAALDGDRRQLMLSIKRDFLFIPAYVAFWIVLGLRSRHPAARQGRTVRLLLVVLPLGAGIFDVLENRASLAALASLPGVAREGILWATVWSLLKWAMVFLNLILLGHLLIRQNAPPAVTTGDPPPYLVGSFFRELTGLVFLAAGLLGIVGLFVHSYIASAGVVTGVGFLLTGVLFFYPDTLWQERCSWRSLRA